jgi:membrane protein
MMNPGNTTLVERERLTAWQLLKQAWHFVNEHEVVTRASAIAFSAMMAAVPFLLMLITVFVQLLPDMSPGKTGGGSAALMEQLEIALKSMFPPEAFNVFEDQIARIQAQPPVAVISISVAITLWCAASVFISIIDALNHIYGVKESRPYWRLRIRAIGMVILQMLIVTVALIGIICWPNVAAYLGLDTTSWYYNTGVRWFMVVFVVMLSFALSFHMGPDVKQRHRWVTPGSIVGTGLFLLACYGLKAYLAGFAHYDKTYGSLGGVMALLFWFYISSLVFLLAAEINRIVDYAIRFGTEEKKLGECVHHSHCSTVCGGQHAVRVDGSSIEGGTKQIPAGAVALVFINADDGKVCIHTVDADQEAVRSLLPTKPPVVTAPATESQTPIPPVQGG